MIPDYKKIPTRSAVALFLVGIILGYVLGYFIGFMAAGVM